MQVKPWVKTSLAPGSQVVTEYLKASGLQKDLDKLGFDLVGYGCTTCIGNSGPLPEPISEAIRNNDLVAAAVLSGNRNFEGRVNPDVRANYLASPPLVVAYALAGSLNDRSHHRSAWASTRTGKPVYLRDIWPEPRRSHRLVRKNVTREAFRRRYKDVFKGDAEWAQDQGRRRAHLSTGTRTSTYVQNPPYFAGMTMTADTADQRRPRRASWACSSIRSPPITSLRPAPSSSTSPAGKYLIEQQVAPVDFNSYGARRGNHEVMMRGTFANIRIKNQMVPGVEGGVTVFIPAARRCRSTMPP